MANPYQQPHPGPSTYYPPPPPMHYAYGTHSPVSAYPPYSYPDPSSNGRPRSFGRGGSGYAPRGHAYPNHVPPQHFALPIHAPHPQHSAQYVHPPPQKFQSPYSPPQAFGPTAPYSPTWQAQQPLSPLPKQLLMPPPRISPIQLETAAEQPPPPAADPAPAKPTFADPVPLPTPTPPPPTQPDRTSSPASRASSRPSSPPAHHPRVASPGKWAIWSRRPTDPAHAPGIIFSPRTRPPPGIVEQALTLPTPPASPVPELLPAPAPIAEAAPDTTPPSEAPSSAATETTPTTTRPGSPVSTNTSVSLGAGPAKEPEASTSALPSSPPQAAPLPVASPPPPAAPTMAAAPVAKKSWASLLRPGTSAAPAPNALPTSAVVGFSVPAAASPAPTPAPAGTSPDLLALLSSPPPATTAGTIRPRGLVNSGNMCFANSVLQVLVYCAPFHALFAALGRVPLGPVVGGSARAPLVEATVDFLKEFADLPPRKVVEGKGKSKAQEGEGEDEECDGCDSFIPTQVYDAMKEKKRFDSMRGGHQEDAEEFFGFYLDTLEEELLALAQTHGGAPRVEEREEAAPAEREDGWLEVGRKNRTVVTRTIRAAESPITRIFGGKFRSTLRAPHQKDSVVIEDWRSLRLDIQREQVDTIEDALSGLALPQAVTVGAGGAASQQVLIEALPQVLVLHLKRFCYDAEAGEAVKVAKHVRFGPELEIPHEILAKRQPPARYTLFGVLYHHGASAGGGHYTLDVRRANGAGWARIDDEVVTDVRPADVFGPPARDGRTAYLLFYARR